jgi:hypothetical protein
MARVPEADRSNSKSGVQTLLELSTIMIDYADKGGSFTTFFFVRLKIAFSEKDIIWQEI